MTHILFFGRLRDVAQRAQLPCALPASVRTVADVRAWLGEADPAIGAALASPGVRVAVNQRICLSDDEPVLDAWEIAFMSPLSGG